MAKRYTVELGVQDGFLVSICRYFWRTMSAGTAGAGVSVETGWCDPLDKELEARGYKFARYADDFIVTVKSANAAKREMASLTRYCEGRLQLIVNRAISRAALLKTTGQTERECTIVAYIFCRTYLLVWSHNDISCGFDSVKKKPISA
jgi:hypothetical protein